VITIVTAALRIVLDMSISILMTVGKECRRQSVQDG